MQCLLRIACTRHHLASGTSGMLLRGQVAQLKEGAVLCCERCSVLPALMQSLAALDLPAGYPVLRLWPSDASTVADCPAGLAFIMRAITLTNRQFGAAWVIFDGDQKRVLAARDSEGSAAMHWGTTDDGRFMFGSDPIDLTECNPTATPFPAGAQAALHPVAFLILAAHQRRRQGSSRFQPSVAAAWV